MRTDEHPGPKRLTPQNAYELDPASKTFIAAPIGKGVTNLTVSDWNRLFLDPQLSAAVPADLAELFEVARGMACYGCFYYPLYRTAEGELFRVQDAATVYRCRALGASANQSKTYQNRVTWLHDQGAFDDSMLGRINAGRSLRNTASHATNYQPNLPQMTLGIIHTTVEIINTLFPESDGKLAIRSQGKVPGA